MSYHELKAITFVGCREGDIRLAGGINSYEGRVEICLGNEYGTVCDQMWDVLDATVVCRQIGLSNTGIESVALIFVAQLLSYVRDTSIVPSKLW